MTKATVRLAATDGKQEIEVPVEALLKKKTDPDAPELDGMAEDTSTVAGAELRAFIERLEKVDAEKKDLADHRKEIVAEAKGRGYDAKAIAKVLALRKMDANDRAEHEAVVEMYMASLGM